MTISMKLPDYLMDYSAFRFNFGDDISSEALMATDGVVSYLIPNSIAAKESVTAQLMATNGAVVDHSDTFTLIFGKSIERGDVPASGTPYDAIITANEAARHTHNNSTVLDKLTEQGGNLRYNGAVMSKATHTHAAATTSANGFMSSSDKTKLNGIAENITQLQAIMSYQLLKAKYPDYNFFFGAVEDYSDTILDDTPVGDGLISEQLGAGVIGGSIILIATNSGAFNFYSPTTSQPIVVPTVTAGDAVILTLNADKWLYNEPQVLNLSQVFTLCQ